MNDPDIRGFRREYLKLEDAEFNQAYYRAYVSPVFYHRSMIYGLEAPAGPTTIPFDIERKVDSGFQELLEIYKQADKVSVLHSPPTDVSKIPRIFAPSWQTKAASAWDQFITYLRTKILLSCFSCCWCSPRPTPDIV